MQYRARRRGFAFSIIGPQALQAQHFDAAAASFRWRRATRPAMSTVPSRQLCAAASFRPRASAPPGIMPPFLVSRYSRGLISSPVEIDVYLSRFQFCRVAEAPRVIRAIFQMPISSLLRHGACRSGRPHQYCRQFRRRDIGISRLAHRITVAPAFYRAAAAAAFHYWSALRPAEEKGAVIKKRHAYAMPRRMRAGGN